MIVVPRLNKLSPSLARPEELPDVSTKRPQVVRQGLRLPTELMQTINFRISGRKKDSDTHASTSENSDMDANRTQALVVVPRLVTLLSSWPDESHTHSVEKKLLRLCLLGTENLGCTCAAGDIVRR